MKLISKYQKGNSINKEQVKDRDINSNWGYAIPYGGIPGINRFGKDFGFIQNGTRQLTMKGTKEPISIPIFQKPLSSSLK